MEPVELTIITRNKTKEGLNEIARDTSKVGQTVEQVTDDFKARMKEQSEAVKQVEADIKSLEKQLENAAPGKAKMELTAELNAAKKVLAEEKGELAALEKQVNQSAQKHTMLRTEIRNLKEQMADMTEGTEEYAVAMQKLGEMQDRMGDINTQGRIFSDDNKNIRATMDAVSGLTGVMTAGVGVASLFGAEEEKLAQIQTKLQAVMAITMGVQQVANTLNKDSYFTHILLTGAKNMLTAATTRLSVALGISNVAAKALMATMTLGLTAAIGALIYLWNKYTEKSKKSQRELNTEIEKTQSSMQNLSDDVDFDVRIAEAAGKSKKELIELRKEAAKTALALADANYDKVLEQHSKGKASTEQLNKAKDIADNAWKSYNQAMQDAVVYDYEEQTNKKKKNESFSDKANEISDAELKARQKINDMTIVLMKEGEEKKKALARKQFDEELARIDQEERDRLKALQKAQKNGMAVTPEQVATVKDQAKQQRDLAGEQYIKDFYDVEKEYAERSKKLKKEKIQALIDYNKEYGTYQEKRLAIEMKFNEEIADITEKRKEAEKKGDTDTVETMNIALAKATKDKGKALMGLDYEQLKQSPDYVRAFENLKETSSSTLKSLLAQFENAKQTAAEVLSPDQLREYTTTIQEIMNELDERNPFQALADRKKELAEAEEELAEAKRNLETVNSGGKVVTGSSYNKDTGKIDKTYLSSAEALEKYNKAKDKAVKANTKVQAAEKKVADVIGDLSQAMKGLGDAIGGQAGEIIGIIGDIGMFAMTAMSGVSTASETASSAVKAVEKASVILAIISAAIQIAIKIASLFKDDDGVAEYERAKEVYESYINILDKVIEKQKELFELNSKTGQQAYETAKIIVQKQEDASRELGKQYLNSGASKGFLGFGSSASEGVKQQKDISSKAWNEAKKALGSDFYKYNIGDGRMTGLFDLSVEQLKKLQETAPLFWAELYDDTQKYLQQIIDCNDELTQLENDRKEGLVKADFDSFLSSFTDVLTDMDSSSKDFADNFEEYLKNAILSSLITDKYRDRIKRLYDNWADATESDEKLTAAEAEALRKEQEAITEEMLQKRKELADAFGWGNSSSSQSGHAGAVTTITEETAGKLEGIGMSMQIHVINMDDKLTDISQYAYEAIGILNTIAENTAFCKRLDDIADIMERTERDGMKMK
ncbi:hypothetical protein AAE250_11785 [Bacteroides sp. GD17]|jgi:hypothetical protein|uniref:hypothetical protein n=1 Tax=Bacteroides sp. GD17 TaxID=3139826 RepID=UPI00204ED91F|nr:hypothetical protein [uncultured Bacteroides sp.]DAV44327.1 MAG TPA: Tape measure domain protein [Caudoviricetes sp.]